MRSGTLFILAAVLGATAVGFGLAQNDNGMSAFRAMPVAGTPLTDTELTDVDLRLAEEAEADRRVARGPYFDDPAAMELLDGSDRGDCPVNSLAFGCLVQARAAKRERVADKLANPFNISVATPIRDTIIGDLDQPWGPGTNWGMGASQIPKTFWADEHSKIELVGIVARLDRKFVPDDRDGRAKPQDCGEVSLIYRFGYDLGGGNASRLPVTMNVVFPMLPDRPIQGVTTCSAVAARWLAAISAAQGKTGRALFNVLTHPRTGLVPLLPGNEIDRIELNIQVYRRATSAEQGKSDLGSTAEYVIRVFRWNVKAKAFEPSYLFNQIDRNLLMTGQTDSNSCADADRTITPDALWKELFKPDQIGDIDDGTVIIPRRFLACRAISMSPGGEHRSGNNPFWDFPDSNAIFPREQARQALENARRYFSSKGSTQRLRMIANVEDLRTRLSQLSCTGCHQTRAIAGFHFPGKDRQTEFGANAVSLSGSAHFFGDQSRRVRIMRAVATGKSVAMTTSYASRPLATESIALRGSHLIGGWGGICRIPVPGDDSQRQWNCQSGYSCRQQFVSTAAPDIGTCVPSNSFQIGDATQVGRVTTIEFRQDVYKRLSERMKAYAESKGSLVVLKPELFPRSLSNAYYSAQQEFYSGLSDIAIAARSDARERTLLTFQKGTGGFPSGSLRLVECSGLPFEANCGLLATSGFTDCLQEVNKQNPLSRCFQTYTSFAGARACSASMPCRDDYICLKGLGWNKEQIAKNHNDRLMYRAKRYEAEGTWGQNKPEQAWGNRNGGRGDTRGVCVPPYFVAQFKSDGHPH
jgi:hypothetical protein